MRAAGTALACVAMATASAAWPGAAAAHAFGQRYDLPLPLGLYLAGAGTAVAVTFVVAALLARRPDPGRGAAGGVAVLAWSGDSPAPVRLAGAILRALVVAALVLVVVAGLAGTQQTFKNIAPVAVWVIWWVGLAFLSALLGDVWRWLNPFATVFALFERHRAPRPDASAWPARRDWPSWLGVWPAFVLYAAFCLGELIWPDRDRPAALAFAIVLYATITWGGMALFGRESWLARGEAFSVAFGLIARVAPLAVHATPEGGALRLRVPGTGLLTERAAPPSMVAFVLLMLATVSFDGFSETAEWLWLQDTAARLAGEEAFDEHSALGIAVAVAGLAAAVLLLALAYLAAIGLMARVAGAPAGWRDLAGRFVLTLMPIAVAYHLAHYFSYLVTAGQFVIPLASDPLGLGWDLFGTALHLIDVAPVGAWFVWYLSVGAIVAGHMMSVWLAHVTALDLYGDRATALRSQVPMAVLMVGYTIFSLWMLAQPIVA